MSGRCGERGLSLLEAVIIATITSLLAILVMPLLPSAATGSLAIAARGVDTLDASRAQREFRMLVRAAMRQGDDNEQLAAIEGQADAVLLRTALQSPVSCARAGTAAVRLSLEEDALVCTCEEQRRVVLRWRDESVGAFSYSADGAHWLSQTSGVDGVRYVRLQLRARDRLTASWFQAASAS
jgi:type II secretory pathway component PulJ